MSATVTGGASAPFELSLGEKQFAVGDVHVQTDLHVQYGEAAAPMFAVDATLRFVVGGAPAPISGTGTLTFRVPLDGDGVAAVNMSAALQIFPKGVPAAIRQGRSVVLSGNIAKLDDAPEELFSIGGVAVSGLGVTAVAYTLVDRLAHHAASLCSNSVAQKSAASSMTVRGVAAVMGAVGLNLTDLGLTPTSVVDALVTGGSEPAAIKAGILHLFFKATSIASKLAADSVPAHMVSIDVKSIIEVLMMFGDADAAGIAALDKAGRSKPCPPRH